MQQWLDRNRYAFFLILVVIIITGAILLQVLRQEPSPILLSTAIPNPSPETMPTPSPLLVYVSGAVRRPDVYTLQPDSIVKDAMVAAGGPADDADLDRINLAAPVADGQHVYVPHQGEEQPPVDLPSRSSIESEGESDRININTADVTLLETLPGIGPSLAQRIVDYRQANGPFDRIEDITNVSGIGQATFAKVQDLIETR